MQQTTPRSNHQQKHYTFVRSRNGEQCFPGLGSLKLYSSCYQLFVLSFFTVNYTATLSSTCFWIFLPSGVQSGEETDVGKQRLNRALESLSSLSLFSFSELNKALDTNEYNWWRVFVFFPKELKLGPTYPRLAIFSLRELNQTSPLVCFEGWNKFSVPIWSPWEPNLSIRRSRCQLGLLSINFVFLVLNHLNKG